MIYFGENVLLRSKINQKKLNENFSSIDPQGQESKAHRLWKWLMDNGPKTREEIYSFDRSYSTVLAKYWRNGLIKQNGELYSAVPNYKFVDVRQIEDKNSELERIFQKFKDVKYKNIEDYINKYKKYHEKLMIQTEIIDQFVINLQSMQKKIDSMLKSASYIDKNKEIYKKRGASKAIHPAEFYKEQLKAIADDIKYIIKHPESNNTEKLQMINWKLGTSIPSKLDSNIKDTSDKIEYYKSLLSNDDVDVEHDIQIRENLLQRYKKLKESSLELKNLVRILLDENRKIIENNPGLRPESPKDVITWIPNEVFDDYKKLASDPVYNRKVNDLIFYELSTKVDEVIKNL